MNRVIFSLIVVALVCAGCAQHHPVTQASNADPHAQADRDKFEAMAKMSEQEMMEKVKHSGTPSTGHANLQPLVGTWQTETKWWKSPGTDPQVSKGTANNQWMLGKRFVKEEYKGQFAGQAFQGVGTLGYDNAKKEYVSTWVDSMSTGIMTSEGSYDPTSRSIVMNGKFTCPITESEMENRTVTRILNNNSHVFEMYARTPDGNEYKTLEITYKRKA